MAYEYTFPAIRGVQAGREYYVTMLPLGFVVRLLRSDEREADPAKRAQRLLSKARVPEIARYIVNNPDGYVFSALTVSVDADFRFAAQGDQKLDRRLGVLTIPSSARFVINDWQHRVAAIREALQTKRKSLADESIAVVLFQDIGLVRSQQVFADLNRYPVRPAPSITVLYDHRDELAGITREVIRQLAVFHELTEVERSSLSKRSSALFTLSAINTANRALLADLSELPVERKQDLPVAYWQAVIGQFPAWEQVRAGTLSAADVRGEFIHASGLALHALGRVGNSLIQSGSEVEAWPTILAPLGGMDWRRQNTALWEGRATNGGQLSKSHAHVLLTTAVIRRALGLSVPPQERWLEAQAGYTPEAGT